MICRMSPTVIRWLVRRRGVHGAYAQQQAIKARRTAGTFHRMPPLQVTPDRWKCAPGSNTRCMRRRYKLLRLIPSSLHASVVPHQSTGDTAGTA